MLKSEYDKEYYDAKKDPLHFWSDKASQLLEWSKTFTQSYEGSFGSDKWFSDGELNACYNCIDRWAKINPDKVALIFDDNDGRSTTFTYKQCLQEIYKICHQLKHLNKGDCVTFYLSMSPNAVFCALACARLGLTHNAVFGGFSSDSLLLRIQDSKSKLLITQEFASRGEKKIDFLDAVVKATKDLDIEVIVFNESSKNTHFLSIKNLKLWSNLSHSIDPVACVNVPSEHPLFYLYTSGSTGMPKGLVHSTGGYLCYAAYTLKTAFDIKSNDVFCCTADIGWITGHSYSIYGPLALGITTVILEGLPTYPDYYRFFNVVEKYKVTQFYTAPTAIRILKKYFDSNPLELGSYDFSHLRCLGSVGEPINKEAHKFFSDAFGKKHIVDTYWQTETGGFLIAPIFGVKTAKPESAMLPMPGIVPLVTCTDEIAKNEKYENVIQSKPNQLGRIYIAHSWPGIARGIINNQERYTKCYFSTPFYFTGDEGIVDEDGDFWIKGRADDVINVSGHRISTAEVESTACTDKNVAEAAVVSVPHDIKGQSMILFVVLKKHDDEFEEKIKQYISKHLGGFCRPDKIIECSAIPKTATGKIMRRILKSLLNNTEIGDLSTCINIDAVDNIKNILSKSIKNNVE